MNSNHDITCQIGPSDPDQTFIQSFNGVFSSGEHTVQPDQQHSVPMLLVAFRTFQGSDFIITTANIYNLLYNALNILKGCTHKNNKNTGEINDLL